MKKLLLVEADLLGACVLDVSLREAGYAVSTVGDGVEAVERVQADPPDLVITDLRPPRLDAFALVRTVRQQRDLSQLPVIVIGPDDSEADKRRALELGVDQYVGRPVYVRELIARIELLFARRVRYALDALRGAMDPQRFDTTTDDIAPVDLLLGLAASGKSAVVHVRSGIQSARIMVRAGAIVDADLGGLRGEEALQRALLWREATFHVDFRSIDSVTAIGGSIEATALRAMRRVDDWVRLRADVRPIADALHVDPDRLLEPPIPATSGALPSARPESRPPLPEAIQGRIHDLAVRPDRRDEGAEAIATATSHHPPSAAPWTRDAPLSEAPVLDTPEGVPSRRIWPMRRALVAGAALVGVVVCVVALRARGPSSPGDGHEGRGAAIPAPETPAPAVTATAAQPPSPPETAAAAPAAPAPAPVARPKEMTVSRASPAAPVYVPTNEPRPTRMREKRAHSPLIADAQRALLTGDNRRAAALAEKVVSADPWDAEAWLTLAATRKVLGDSNGARDAYRQCLIQAHNAGLNDCHAFAWGLPASANPEPSP